MTPAVRQPQPYRDPPRNPQGRRVLWCPTCSVYFPVTGQVMCPTCLTEPRTRRCYRCGHTWTPRGNRDPKQCPTCKSPYWDRARSRAPLRREYPASTASNPTQHDTGDGQ